MTRAMSIDDLEFADIMRSGDVASVSARLRKSVLLTVLAGMV
jgi:hypothetical protein